MWKGNPKGGKEANKQVAKINDEKKNMKEKYKIYLT